MERMCQCPAMVLELPPCCNGLWCTLCADHGDSGFVLALNAPAPVWRNCLGEVQYTAPGNGIIKREELENPWKIPMWKSILPALNLHVHMDFPSPPFNDRRVTILSFGKPPMLLHWFHFHLIWNCELISSSRRQEIPVTFSHKLRLS